jgi:hypothetical protein
MQEIQASSLQVLEICRPPGGSQAPAAGTSAPPLERVRICTLGATLTHVWVRAAPGSPLAASPVAGPGQSPPRLLDVVSGYEEPAALLAAVRAPGNPYMGALVGRVANR